MDKTGSRIASALLATLSLLLAAAPAAASPMFFWAPRGQGVFEIDATSGVATRVDSLGTNDVIELARYGTNQIIASDYGYAKVSVLNADGSTAATYTPGANPYGVAEKPGSGGHIYWADYFGSKIMELTPGSGSALVSDLTTPRIYVLAARSDGSVYVSYGDDLYRGSDGALVASNDDGSYFSWMTVGANDDILFGATPSSTGSFALKKLSSSNVVSTFWTNSSVGIIDISYNPSDGLYYAIGRTTAGQFNMYSFTAGGAMSLVISGLSGTTFGTDEAGFLVLDTAASVPEPASLALAASAALAAAGAARYRRTRRR